MPLPPVWSRLLAAAVAPVVALPACGPIGAGDPTAGAACPPPPPVSAAAPLLGVYTGNEPQEVHRFEHWLGRPVDAVLGYTGDADWDDYDGSVGWATDLWSGIDRPVLWSVPLIPEGAELDEAARGDYDHHYRKAAESLAATRPQDPVVYVRTGWELNGNWFPWAARGRTEAFKEAFRRFAEIFRATSRRFVIEWNVSIGDVGMDPETAYPGDCHVDIIGMDFYWNTAWDPGYPDAAWRSMLERRWGLRWHQDFAAAHGKPTAYSEWGVGNDAAPAYIEQARRWFDDHPVIYHTFWDSNAGFVGKLSSGQFPASGDAYRRAFSGRRDDASRAGRPPPGRAAR